MILDQEVHHTFAKLDLNLIRHILLVFRDEDPWQTVLGMPQGYIPRPTVETKRYGVNPQLADPRGLLVLLCRCRRSHRLARDYPYKPLTGELSRQPLRAEVRNVDVDHTALEPRLVRRPLVLLSEPEDGQVFYRG